MLTKFFNMRKNYKKNIEGYYIAKEEYHMRMP